MGKSHIYNKIVQYLKEKDWGKEPIEGTFCPGRKSQKNKIVSVMMSAVFPGMLEKKICLNVLATETKKGIKSITLGVLDGRFKDREEIYRIDYDSKGWHIDSKKYKLKHRKIKDITDWRQAIDLIIKHELSLPFSYFNKKEINHYTTIK